MRTREDNNRNEAYVPIEDKFGLRRFTRQYLRYNSPIPERIELIGKSLAEICLGLLVLSALVLYTQLIISQTFLLIFINTIERNLLNGLVDSHSLELINRSRWFNIFLSLESFELILTALNQSDFLRNNDSWILLKYLGALLLAVLATVETAVVAIISLAFHASYYVPKVAFLLLVNIPLFTYDGFQYIRNKATEVCHSSQGNPSGFFSQTPVTTTDETISSVTRGRGDRFLEAYERRQETQATNVF